MKAADMLEILIAQRAAGRADSIATELAVVSEWADSAYAYITGVSDLLAATDLSDPLWQTDALTAGIRGLLEWHYEIEKVLAK